MKRLLLLLIFFFSLDAFSAELPQEAKEVFKQRFPTLEFKIDNSFEVDGEVYLPLFPRTAKTEKQIKIINVVEDESDKSFPKLFELSNGTMFVKLLYLDKEKKTILSAQELPQGLKQRILLTKFPDDLVVPENFILKEEFAVFAGILPIEIEAVNTKDDSGIQIAKEFKELKDFELSKAETKESKPSVETTKENTQPIAENSVLNVKDTLYLTSPDSGEVIYVNLNDLSMIEHIVTEGTPFNITFDKKNKLLFISDFAKSLIYSLKFKANSIHKTYTLPSMTHPGSLSVSEDGSLIYILGSVSSDFTVYNVDDSKEFVKTKLPLNPTEFAFLEKEKLIAVTVPNSNTLAFLKATDFSPVGKIMINGNPEKVISDPLHSILYVTQRNENSVSIVDVAAKKVKSTIEVGKIPVALAVDEKGKILYVANGKSNTISVLDVKSEKVIDTIPLPIETQFPGDIQITSDGKWLVVTSETTSTVSIIDLVSRKVTIKLNVGATTHEALLVGKQDE